MEQTMSPLPKEAEVQKIKAVGELTFPEAIREIIAGKKVTRKEWEDEDAYGIMQDGFLMIKYNGMHQWIISEADMVAEDWIIIK